ncbi:MAG: bifunctional nuclease family protein [Actinomycetia bacterium]|nr:bifunctional nuclease family protein [Actinomycetes bacterium]MCP4226401.1 bifunctional nuclease family protein [Actinomycetes bacterium]MCP5033474.1 bifunctional nuclease family protein [Actinomycetes bacterium]
MTVEMELVGVRVQMPTNTPILLLRETSGRRRVVPIYIGGPEAHAIDLALSGTPTARPMTHDLMAEVIESLGAALERVVVTELREGTFYAELMIRDGSGGVQTLSARPSDAVALAVRTGSQIFAEEALIEEAGIEEAESADEGNEEEMVEELRKFLDEVNPEDFLP